MEHTVKHSWETILGWFEEHCPQQRRSFRGPAAEEDIHAVTAATGRTLPDDHLAWWRLSDGTVDREPCLIPVTFHPAPIADALSRYRFLADSVRDWPTTQALEQEPAGTATESPWLPSWFPIAHNGGGDYLFLDLRPGAQHGCVGRRYRDEVGVSAPIWRSVTDMLGVVADALADDTAIDGWLPAVEDGCLGWQRP